MNNILKISAALAILACAFVTNFVNAQGYPITGGGIEIGVIECKCSNTKIKACYANGESGVCWNEKLCSGGASNCK